MKSIHSCFFCVSSSFFRWKALFNWENFVSIFHHFSLLVCTKYSNTRIDKCKYCCFLEICLWTFHRVFFSFYSAVTLLPIFVAVGSESWRQTEYDFGNSIASLIFLHEFTSTRAADTFRSRQNEKCVVAFFARLRCMRNVHAIEQKKASKRKTIFIAALKFDDAADVIIFCCPLLKRIASLSTRRSHWFSSMFVVFPFDFSIINK